MKCCTLIDRVRCKAREAARTLGNQGAALVTALMFLLILTMLGLASIMTSSTEMMISRNDRLNKLSLDYANAGVQESIARLDLMTPGGLTLGNFSTKANTANPAWAQKFSSTQAAADPMMNFSGTVKYRLEDSLHYRGMYTGTGVVNGQVVGYSKDCGYDKSPIASVDNAYPVYQVECTGWVNAANKQAASSRLTIEVSRNTINLDVPGALYSQSCIDANGNVTVTGGDKQSYVTTCTGNPSFPNGIDTHGNASRITSGATPQYYADSNKYENMTGVHNFLGMSFDELKSMASTAGTYYEMNGTNSWVSPYGAPPGNWGDYYNMKNPKIVYVDTKGHTFDLGGQSWDFGILIVRGNLNNSGKTHWRGLVYVTGDLKCTGTLDVQGGVMVSGATATDLGGTVDIVYNKTVLDSVARQAFHTKILNWRRVYR